MWQPKLDKRTHVSWPPLHPTAAAHLPAERGPHPRLFLASAHRPSGRRQCRCPGKPVRVCALPSHARSRFRADPRRVDCGGGLGRTNGAARVAAALAPAEAAPRARCLCSGDVRNSGEGPARPRRYAEACRLQGHALCARTHKQRGAGVAEFLSPRKLRCFRRNSAPLYCVCARVGHTPLVRQRCGFPVSKDTTIGWHRPAAHDS